MTGLMRNANGSLFDFGPLAPLYEGWYDTDMGQAFDRIQRRDVLCLLEPYTPGGMVLDVGCGTGHWSGFFEQLGFRVVGVDVSARMIQEARLAHPNCRFQRADAARLPFSDGSMDMVVVMAALEFMAQPLEALAEMIRCLKPGGRLLIGTLNRLAPINQQRLLAGEEPYASGRLYSPMDLWRLLSRFGRVRMVGSTMQQPASPVAGPPPGDAFADSSLLVAEVLP